MFILPITSLHSYYVIYCSCCWWWWCCHTALLAPPDITYLNHHLYSYTQLYLYSWSATPFVHHNALEWSVYNNTFLWILWLFPSIWKGESFPKYYRGIKQPIQSNTISLYSSFSSSDINLRNLFNTSPALSHRQPYIFLQLQCSLIIVGFLQFLLGATGLVGIVFRYVGPVTITPTLLLIGFYLFKVIVKFSETHWGISLAWVRIFRFCSILLLNFIFISLSLFRLWINFK